MQIDGTGAEEGLFSYSEYFTFSLSHTHFPLSRAAISQGENLPERRGKTF